MTSSSTSLRALRRTLILAATAVLVVLAVPAASHAAVCDAPIQNPVACENSKPGADPNTWQIDKAGDPTIQGFATAMSVNKGETISFKIKSNTPNFSIDILRLGYYGGAGAREWQTGLRPTGPTTQPPCQTFSDTGLIDCGNWSVTRTWTVPSNAVSGIYIAHLKKDSGGGDSHITFVVRDDASTSDIVLQTSDSTWQAYNTYGGNSLYQCTVACPPGNPSTYKAAYKVSYNRPLNTPEDDGGRSALFTGAEYSMVRWLERNGYDLSYISNVDTHRRPALLLNHGLFVSSGHDEYWSQTQRTNVEAARNAGVNLAFFSGNEVFWKTRWEPSAAGASTQDRTLVSYKDTHFTQQEDPVEWTGTWRDPRFTTPQNGPTPENALTGQSFLVNLGSSAITVPYAYRNLRMWRNTAAATQSNTSGSVALAPQTLGYEWDEDADNGFRPAGQVKLSSTTVGGLEVFTDYGSTVKTNGTATHNLTMYKAPGGARVFGAGTVQWSWGLDAENPIGNAEDRNMQQATVNLLADLDAQPDTRQANLSAASKTTDTTAPTSSIANPPTTVADGTRVTLAGTAADTGGAVAGVEVSTDGGSTWHPATGTTSWSYSWVAHGNPSTVIKWRATDDSGNTQTAGAGVTVTVTCPCSLWGNNVTPATADAGDPTPVEVGMKFKSDGFGTITGVRFYKSAANTGTHTGSLWTAGGQRLAQVTFQGESATGWQSAQFSQPVQVQPGQTYIVSYYAPNGHYAATADYFWRQPAPGPNGGAMVDSAPLHAIRNTVTEPNGLYSYGATSTFPTNAWSGSNYWVDVMFQPIPAPGAVSNVSATSAGRTSAEVSWTAPASGGAVTQYKITPYVGTTAGTPKLIDGTPPETTATVGGLTTGTTYRFTVQALNPAGGGPVSAQSNAVTPADPVAPSPPTAVSAQPAGQQARVQWTAPASDGDSPITGYRITPYVGATAQTPTQVGATATSAIVTGLTNGTAYTFRVAAINAVGTGTSSSASNAVTPQATIFDFGAPAAIDSNDGSPVEVGVKFRADSNGQITGLRFYKGAANTGIHTGTLWNASGGVVASGTFTNESASGWQTMTFASPASITAGTTYVASYHAPQGHYSATGGAFSSQVDNGLLHALATGTSANGVYTYSATSTFPTSTYNASNYWVDVMYAVPVPGAVSGVTAEVAGQTSAKVTWTAPTAGGSPTSYKVTPYVGTTAQTPKIVSGTPPATETTVSGLTSGTSYRFTVQAINANGSGPESAQSNAVTPQAAVVPTAPTNVSAQPATSSARVTWSVPSSDGDSPITGYRITPYDGATAQAATTVGAAVTSATVTGLTDGTAYTFRVAATNAVGTGAASAATAAVTPRRTIFDFATPATVDSGDGNAVEVGLKFRSSFEGTITGVRFYKGAANTGTHVGSLWTAAGSRMTFGTFSGETGSGWQTLTFASPQTITANTTYVVSYHAPNGHYSVTGGGLSTAVDSGPLQALASGTSANGVYGYGPAGTFPTSTFNAGNYWVDVLYAPGTAPGQVTGVTATAGQASATVSWTAPSGGTPSSYTITPYVGTTAQTAKTITGSPPATSTTVSGLTPGTGYTFRVSASNAGGKGPDSAPSNTVTPTGAQAPGAPTGVAAAGDTKSALVSWSEPASDGGSAITGYTVTPYAGSTAGTPVTVGAATTSTRVTGLTNDTAYTFKVKAANGSGTGPESAASNAVTPLASIFDLATPATVDAGDGGSVVLGVKFTADVNGTIAGIRFYKAAANTGTHVGALWSAAGGAALREATFSGESASGWQTVRFATPVAVTAGQTYVASYLAPNGHYSANGAGFASGAVVNAPLRALADSTSQNGVYAYGTTNTFPSNSWNATNYWVDVLFAPGA